MHIVAALLASYFLGAIPFGLLVGKVAKGIDIRDFGSGNIGATNVLRTLGPGLAFVVFLLDTAKGLAAVLICRWLGLDPWWVVAGALLAVLGHTFSVFLRFRGGKGVATSLGVIVGLDPVIAGITFALWLIIAAVTRYISVASILAAVSVPLQMIFWHARVVPLPYQLLACAAALTIVLKHKSNIGRLRRGVEAKLGQKVDVG